MKKRRAKVSCSIGSLKRKQLPLPSTERMVFDDDQSFVEPFDPFVRPYSGCIFGEAVRA